MEIRFIGKHFKITPGIRDHVEEKLEKITKFRGLRGLIEAKVLFKIEKYLYIAEITLVGKNLRFYGEGRSEQNFFAAFDEAELKVAAQLKKMKEKVKSHKLRGGKERAEAPVPEEAAAKGASRREGLSRPGRLVVESSAALKPMTVEEAKMQLTVNDRPFYVFRNPETGDVNVIFRREDGNFGLIES
ncbi:MAG: ribosome-associated translation inhibitor RaiA [Candidatus Omnitrophica bacterium]|nr:ribosome-associated translation inhibitor RaiA [Candidatus Omnitrophota bacterium]